MRECWEPHVHSAKVAISVQQSASHGTKLEDSQITGTVLDLHQDLKLTGKLSTKDAEKNLLWLRIHIYEVSAATLLPYLGWMLLNRGHLTTTMRLTRSLQDPNVASAGFQMVYKQIMLVYRSANYLFCSWCCKFIAVSKALRQCLSCQIRCPSNGAFPPVWHL